MLDGSASRPLMNPLPEIVSIAFTLAAAGSGLMMLSFWIEWYGD
jgi:hypothetical protein